MNAPKRKIVIAKRPHARRIPVFAEDEPPTTPYRAHSFRTDERPTVRPQKPVARVPVSGIIAKTNPRSVPPPLPKPISLPPPLPIPRFESDPPTEVVVSRPAVIPPAPREETFPPLPPRSWSLRIAVVLVIVASELWLAQYGGMLRLPADIGARVMSVLAGD